MTTTSTITIQQATAADDAALRALAQLDSARPVERPALLARIDGRAVAAASLRDERVVADPFADSAEAARLLRQYRASLHGGRRRRAPRIPRLRLRPRPAI